MPATAIGKPVSPILQPGGVNTGLVLGMPFSEGGGLTVNDLSGQGNNGTLNGGVEWEPGPFGQCLAFDGSTGYISASDARMPLGDSPRTMSVWFATTSANVTVLMSYGTNTRSREAFTFYVFGVLHFATTNYDIDTSITVNDGHWRQVTATYAGGIGDILLYLDGVLIGTLSGQSLNTVANGLYLGQYGGGQFFLNGNLDNVRILSRALSRQEIAQDYVDAFAWCRPRRRVFASTVPLTPPVPPIPPPVLPVLELDWIGKTNVLVAWAGNTSTQLNWIGQTNVLVAWQGGMYS